jgi:hypothetical protein
MAHFISGLVADASFLTNFAESLSLSIPVGLERGFAFLPIDDEDVVRVAGRSEPLVVDDEFAALDLAFIPVVQDRSTGGAIVYLQTEYFGGEGGQAALLAQNGELVYGPTNSTEAPHPICQALALLGVTRSAPNTDEFDSVGLSRFRNNDDWRRHATKGR